MIDLGTLREFGDSLALAVNAAGQVVGQSTFDHPGVHAFSWTPEDGMIDLGTLGGRMSWADAVSESGQVAGTILFQDDRRPAFSWTQAGGMTDLGTLGGRWSQVSAINERGRLAGSSELADGAIHAVLWKTEPSHELSALAEMLAELALPFGTANSLGATLARASAALAAGENTGTCNALAAFISKTTAQRGKKLTPDEADSLVASATDVRAMLACPGERGPRRD